MENQNPTLQTKPGKYAWFVVIVLFIVAAINILDRTMITTMRLSIKESIPMTEAQFGLLSSVFLWVYGFMNPIAGFLADKFSRVKVIIISMLVWSVTTLLTAKVTTFNQLLITRVVMGLSEACYLPAALALIMDYHRGPTQSRATGLHMCGMQLGGSLGFLGGYMAMNHEWNYGFKIFGIIGIAYTIFALCVLREAHNAPVGAVAVEEEPEDKEPFSFWEAFKHLFTNKAFVMLAIFWGVVGILGQIEAAWLPTFYQEQFGITQSKAGFFATACLNPAQMVGLLLGGTLADVWSKKNRYARILIPIIGVCIAAPAVFFASYTTILWVAVGFFMVYGMTRMFVDTNLMPIIVASVDKRYRATGYGLMNMFTTVLGGLGVLITGMLRDSQIELRAIFQIVSISLLASVIFLILIKRIVEKKDKEAAASNNNQ